MDLKNIVGIRMIVAIFYFSYWFYYLKLPFSIYWFIGICIADYLIISIVTVLLERTTTTVMKMNEKEKMEKNKIINKK